MLSNFIIDHVERDEVCPSQDRIEAGDETILLAEDDQMTRELLTSTLSSYGYNVVAANDGNDAVTIFKEHADRIKLLLLDITMPHKSGSAAYEEILTINPEMKAIFMTGYPINMYQDNQLKYPGCELLQKPVFIAALTNKIREMLDGGDSHG